MGGFKKIVSIIALLAVLNLLGVAGLAGYLVSSGRLTSERVKQLAAVLRGEWPEPEAAQAEEAEEIIPPEKSAESIVEEEFEDQIMRLTADRRRAELSQQRAVIQRERLDVMRKREALNRRLAEAKERQAKRKEQEQSAGFKKELEILSGMQPKNAVYWLRQRAPADAAQMLLLMKTRKAKKVIEAAKTPADRKAMAEVLQILREMAPADSELLADKKE